MHSCQQCSRPTLRMLSPHLNDQIRRSKAAIAGVNFFAVQHGRMTRSRGRLSSVAGRTEEQGGTKPLAARNRGEASGPKHLQELHMKGAPAQKQAGAAPASPSRRSPPSPPPLPAAAEALPLPGLDEDSPPETGACQLPLADGRRQASTFGNPFAAADSLR